MKQELCITGAANVFPRTDCVLGEMQGCVGGCDMFGATILEWGVS